MNEQAIENTTSALTKDSQVTKNNSGEERITTDGTAQSGGNNKVGNKFNVPKEGLSKSKIQNKQNVSNAAKSKANDAGEQAMDGNRHTEPKRGSQDVQTDSHIRRFFPDMSEEYVDIMSKSVGLIFDRRTFERAS